MIPSKNASGRLPRGQSVLLLTPLRTRRYRREGGPRRDSSGGLVAGVAQGPGPGGQEGIGEPPAFEQVSPSFSAAVHSRRDPPEVPL